MQIFQRFDGKMWRDVCVVTVDNFVQATWIAQKCASFRITPPAPRRKLMGVVVH